MVKKKIVDRVSTTVRRISLFLWEGSALLSTGFDKRLDVAGSRSTMFRVFEFGKVLSPDVGRPLRRRLSTSFRPRTKIRQVRDERRVKR